MDTYSSSYCPSICPNCSKTGLAKVEPILRRRRIMRITEERDAITESYNATLISSAAMADGEQDFFHDVPTDYVERGYSEKEFHDVKIFSMCCKQALLNFVDLDVHQRNYDMCDSVKPTDFDFDKIKFEHLTTPAVDCSLKKVPATIKTRDTRVHMSS